MAEVRSAGPYVGLAVLCQRVDRQPDGTTDVVGILSDLDIGSPLLGHVEHTVVRLSAVIALRPGDLRGAHVLAVRGRYPGGVDGPMVARLVEFSEEEIDPIFLVPLEIEIEQIGTYWFDVTFDQRVITRIPLRTRRGESWT